MRWPVASAASHRGTYDQWGAHLLVIHPAELRRVVHKLVGGKGEDDLLASCYRTALALAAAQGLSSIAFPAISTGIYRFPPERAARIAVGSVAAEVAHAPRGLTRVVFCCFSPDAAEHHARAFTELGLA